MAAAGRGRRPGFTLLEMLLVLAILLTLFGLAWPSLTRLYGEHHLRQAAEQVRVQLTSARVRALDNGIGFQFRFEPGGRRFVVVPEELLTPQAGARPQVAVTMGELSASMRFDATGFAGANQTLSTAWLQSLPGGGALQGVAWSWPLKFSPDGTASDYRIIVGDSQNQEIALLVRGLTGGVTVSRVYVRSPR